MKNVKTILIVCFGLLLTGCETSSSSVLPIHTNLTGEYIYRTDGESIVRSNNVSSAPLVKQPYPWEESFSGVHPKITKDFFRCKGSGLNPPGYAQRGKESIRLDDCGGPQKHSLPLREGKEFIYPVLIDLLNYIQTRTGKRVVITSGHCCPDHNLYSDSSPSAQSSKHLLGAEVDFYVQGMEEEPGKAIELIFEYYRERPIYAGLKEYLVFERYEKGDTNVSTPPWFNKEIYVKWVKKHEGRDFDNRHPYPYISIQVRYDRDAGEKVNYSWDKAFRNFHRW